MKSLDCEESWKSTREKYVNMQVKNWGKIQEQKIMQWADNNVKKKSNFSFSQRNASQNLMRNSHKQRKNKLVSLKLST